MPFDNYITYATYRSDMKYIEEKLEYFEQKLTKITELLLENLEPKKIKRKENDNKAQVQ